MKSKILTVKGDMFQTGADILVDPINSLGRPGALAAVFAHKFPLQEQQMNLLLEEGSYKPGDSLFVDFSWNFSPIIYYAITVRYSGENSCYPYVIDCLRKMAWIGQKHHKGATIAIPALGCGVGGLDFKYVADYVYRQLHDGPFSTIYLMEPL